MRVLKRSIAPIGTAASRCSASPATSSGPRNRAPTRKLAPFARRTIGVTFPLFAKIDVNGPNAHPLYRFLKKEKPGIFGIFGSGAIRWNFTKFLVDRKGNVVARYGPAKEPESPCPADRTAAGRE